VVRLNALADRVRRDGGLVIFVQHEGPPGDPYHPGEPGFELLPDLHVEPSDRIIRKRFCDAFIETSLASDLDAASVEQIIVTGCATDYCVDTTVRAALSRGHQTLAPSDGHTTTDRPHLCAAKIIEHHNALWEGFISPVGPAQVRPCDEV